MRRHPPRSTRTDTLLPYTTLFRSHLPPTTSDVVGGVARVRLAQSHRSAAASAATCFEMQSSPAMRNISRALSRVLRQPASRSEEHTSELQSLMRISYAVFCLKKKK